MKEHNEPTAHRKFAQPWKNWKFRLPASFWDFFAVPITWILEHMSEKTREDIVNPVKHQESEKQRKFLLNLLYRNLRQIIRTCPREHFFFLELIPSDRYVLPQSPIEEQSLILYNKLHTRGAHWFACQKINEGHYVVGINTAHWSGKNYSDSSIAHDILAEAKKYLHGYMFIIAGSKTMRP